MAKRTKGEVLPYSSVVVCQLGDHVLCDISLKGIIYTQYNHGVAFHIYHTDRQY